MTNPLMHVPEDHEHVFKPLAAVMPGLPEEKIIEWYDCWCGAKKSDQPMTVEETRAALQEIADRIDRMFLDLGNLATGHLSSRDPKHALSDLGCRKVRKAEGALNKARHALGDILTPEQPFKEPS